MMKTMPMELFEKELKGSYVTLHKFHKDYISEIYNIANDERIWRFNKPEDQPIKQFLLHYIEMLNTQIGANTQWPYVVIQNDSQAVIGSTRFYDISFSDKRIAIGFTWYHPSVWGTKVNPECKYLLLTHVFETLKYNRVEFHIDSRNEHSINAVKKLGAQYEGTLRKHKIVQHNFVRDTVVYSIINSEWPDIKQKLLYRIR